MVTQGLLVTFYLVQEFQILQLIFRRIDFREPQFSHSNRRILLQSILSLGYNLGSYQCFRHPMTSHHYLWRVFDLHLRHYLSCYLVVFLEISLKPRLYHFPVQITIKSCYPMDMGSCRWQKERKTDFYSWCSWSRCFRNLYWLVTIWWCPLRVGEKLGQVASKSSVVELIPTFKFQLSLFIQKIIPKFIKICLL